jgi:hypothetical protein
MSKNALSRFMEIPGLDPIAAIARMVEFYAANIEIGGSPEPPPSEMAAAAAAALSAEPPIDFRLKHPSLWPAVEHARDRRAKLTHALNTHQVPIEYAPLILLWFFDAVDFRYRAEAIQSGLKACEKVRNQREEVTNTFLKHLIIDDVLRVGLERRGIALDRLMWALEDLILDWKAEPDRLEYFYFVGSKRGSPKTGRGRELHAILLNLVGMWKELKGQLPKIQPNQTKADAFDETGEPCPTAFVALVRDVAEVLGHRYPMGSLQYAARLVVKELRDQESAVMQKKLRNTRGRGRKDAQVSVPKRRM